MKGSEFIRCANGWVTPPSIGGEPAFRSAISRAYYGAFHHCGEFITYTLQIRMEKGPTQHKKIPIALGYTEHGVLKSAGHKLADLRTNRTNADYHLTRSDYGARIAAELALEEARWIESAIDSFNESPARLAEMQALIAGHFKTMLVGWSISRRLV